MLVFFNVPIETHCVRPQCRKASGGSGKRSGGTLLPPSDSSKHSFLQGATMRSVSGVWRDHAGCSRSSQGRGALDALKKAPKRHKGRDSCSRPHRDFLPPEGSSSAVTIKRSSHHFLLSTRCVSLKL